MAKQQYFGNNIEPKCEYCMFGALDKTGLNILCTKVGVVPRDYATCRKYVYDPLKRVPEKQKNFVVTGEDNI